MVVQLGTLDESHWIPGYNNTEKKGHILQNANSINSCMMKKKYEAEQGSQAALLRTAEAGVKRSSFKMMISPRKQMPQQRWGKALNLQTPFKIWSYFQLIVTSTVNLT